MKTIFYETKVPVRRRVVSMGDYLTRMAEACPEEKVMAPRNLAQRKLRRRLEWLCLLLEAGLCMVLLVVIFPAAIRFFFF